MHGHGFQSLYRFDALTQLLAELRLLGAADLNVATDGPVDLQDVAPRQVEHSPYRVMAGGVG